MRSARIGFDASALRNPAFRLLGIGQIISVIGEQILTVAMTVTILNAGGDASAVGLVLATRGLASVIFLLFGGVWADRLKRRRILIISYGIVAAATWILALVPSRLSSSFWMLAAVLAPPMRLSGQPLLPCCGAR